MSELQSERPLRAAKAQALELFAARAEERAFNTAAAAAKKDDKPVRVLRCRLCLRLRSDFRRRTRSPRHRLRLRPRKAAPAAEMSRKNKNANKKTTDNGFGVLFCCSSLIALS